MNKLFAVIETIIKKSDQISMIEQASQEYFFVFQGYFFSCLYGPNREEKWGPYSFYVYPYWKGPLAQLSSTSSYGEIEESQMIGYHSPYFLSRDQPLLLPKLYAVLETVYINIGSSAVSEIFDTILNPSLDDF